MSEPIKNLPDAVATYGAFPMPVVPEPVDAGPVVRPLAVHEAQLDALTASGNRAVNDAVHEDLCACDAWPKECLSSGGFFQGYWDMGGLETAIPAVLGLWESMRGGELVALRARVAELEAERTQWRQLADLDVDKLAQALLLMETGPALPWAHVMSDDDLHEFLGDLVSAAMGRWRSEPEVPDRTVLADIEKVCADWRTPGQGLRSDEPEALPSGRPVNGLTATFVSVVSVREPEGEHWAAVHHDWRLGRDLPMAGESQ